MSYMSRDQIEFDFIISGHELPDAAYAELAEKQAARMIDGKMCLSEVGLAVLIAHSRNKARAKSLAKTTAEQLENDALKRFRARLAEAGISVD